MGRKAKSRELTGRIVRLGPPDLITPRQPFLRTYARQNLSHAIGLPSISLFGWYCSEPLLSFNKTVVTRYCIHPEDRQPVPATKND
jgi:hypothetical protein